MTRLEEREPVAAVRRRPGGRAARVRDAVLAATIDELSAAGYERLSIPGVAHKAEVSPSTVYRRWATKAELVRDAMLLHVGIELPVADTGSLRGDLTAFALGLDRLLSEPGFRKMVLSLVSIDDADSALFKRSFWERRIGSTAAIADRARDRGEIDQGIDPAELIESVAAPLWLRHLVTGAPVTRAYVEDVVDRALRAFG